MKTDGTAQFTQSAVPQEKNTITSFGQVINISEEKELDKELDKENQSQQSFGTGSFTTNTFNARLKDSHGMQILRYIQSDNFGKYGESIKLIETINVGIGCLSTCIQISILLMFLHIGIHKQADR